ncbi:MAG TPA: hypothetical protein VLW46_00290 [Candidatus Bathyarchaeia archaeon]|nr:hypothetical protein [Candidatus Bathyarchaeia archaeon]
MRSGRVFITVFFAAILFLTAASAAPAQWWTVQTSGIDTNLRAVSAVLLSPGEEKIAVWASGSNGVILRSLDDGKSWKRLHVAGGDSLDFRGIVAFDQNTAYVMSIGNGEKSRIYKTKDGGETWKLQFTGERKEVFLDAIACPYEKECYALGDPVDGKFFLIETDDGKRWKEVSRSKMPVALPNEGAFAASNSSLFVDGDDIYFGTGGASSARVFHSPDSGETWAVAHTPIASANASSGIFSTYYRGDSLLLVVGGDYKDPSRAFQTAAFSKDAGSTWQLASQLPGGFRSALADDGLGVTVAVGPSGEDVSLNQGVTWEHAGSLDLNAVTIFDGHRGWAVGPHGTVARFQNQVQYIMRNEVPAFDLKTKSIPCGLLDLICLSTLPRSLQEFWLAGSLQGSRTGGQNVIHFH